MTKKENMSPQEKKETAENCAWGHLKKGKRRTEKNVWDDYTPKQTEQRNK